MTINVLTPDSEYIKKQEPRSKRSHRKVNCDDMDKSIIVSLMDATSHEITSSTPQQSSTPSEISEDIATSREDTPRPVIQSTQRTSLDTICYLYFARYTSFTVKFR